MSDIKQVKCDIERCICHVPDACWDCSHYTGTVGAVEPICQIIFDVPYYFCGSCKTMLNMYATKAEYCSQCGRPVKWK